MSTMDIEISTNPGLSLLLDVLPIIFAAYPTEQITMINQPTSGKGN